MLNVDEAVQALNAELPDIARAVIAGHLDLAQSENSYFFDNPDAQDQHQTQWHQWGIITHTRKFLQHFRHDIPLLLRDWDLWTPVNDTLREQIDGAQRWELLRFAILLHDVGKFAARTIEARAPGSRAFHFARHEELSGAIIRQEIDLAKFGLTTAQSEYVARTAEDHFVLGLVRKRAREMGEFDPAFVTSTALTALALDIRRLHPDDFIEIGVLFLGDSLAKVQPPDGPERARGQYDLNIAVARRYLDVVLSAPSL